LDLDYFKNGKNTVQGLYQIPGLRYKSGKLESVRLKKIKDFINK
jgi:hypothetical protein